MEAGASLPLSEQTDTTQTDIYMERNRHAERQDYHGRTATSRLRVNAFFDEREEAEIAVNDLERNGIPRNKIAIILPESPQRTGSRSKEKKGVEPSGALMPPALAAGFPGWTAGMAPWAMTGTAPVVVLGSLSLTRHADRPHDLHELATVLGLSEAAIKNLQEGFQRNAILVSAEAPEKTPIANHILERNGGHPLPRKQE